MIHYLYDGSFDGFLTVIYEVFHRHQLPDMIARETHYTPSLLATPVLIETDLEKGEKVSNGIRERISSGVLKNVFFAYLSELEGIEVAVMHYLKLGFQMGERVERLLSDPWVMKIHRACQKVGKENHLMVGLLRFHHLCGDVYYAPMEPDHNILCLIAPHFASRLADQNWIIHDLRRGIAAVYDQQDWVLTPVDSPELTQYSEEEGIYQALWQRFFKQIAIEDRTNPKLQRRLMPARYWSHLVEKVEQKPQRKR